MSTISFPELEEEILKYWGKEKIFEKSLAKESPQGEFVFYEGPPTANGKPGIHHVLARAFKDLIPRYKTMQGYHVTRKAGWDTHGLPVELAVEKELGISGKPDIENLEDNENDSIKYFNNKCKKSVWQYKEDWEKLTKRMGFWLDMENPYVTYENDYIESLWWILKQVNLKGLLYKGYKVVPHCPRCGTALSSHEVAQGYREVPDNSVYIKFKVKTNSVKVKIGDYILSWTTTPWTLPGNVALAIGENIDYVRLHIDAVSEEKNSNFNKGEYYILAKNLIDKVIDAPYSIDSEFKGNKLLGIEYEPLFPGAISDQAENYDNAYKVYAADFVTTEDGTGVVHTAVMYGEEDYQLGEKVYLPKQHTVNENGEFNFIKPQTGILKELQGMSVKHKDKPTEIKTTNKIVKYLTEENILLKEKIYQHDYPFCWRCDTPLLYYAKDSWFIRMSKLREKLKENNNQINWVPEHIKHGRFGEWLDGAKDWAISRERYWGTPLPVWTSKDGKYIEVIGSRKELYEKAINKPTRVILVRHGESEKNVKGIYSSVLAKYPLTEIGEKQAMAYATLLKNENIDFIVSSPVLRTKQTADIIGSKLEIDVLVDDRLREHNEGEWEGKTKAELANDEYYQHSIKLWHEGKIDLLNIKHGKTGDSLAELGEQTYQAFSDIIKNNQGKTILFSVHESNLLMLAQKIHNLNVSQLYDLYINKKYDIASKPVEYYFVDNMVELDLHRPMIDDFKIKIDNCNEELIRDASVLDCWFDSGSMPFAQLHYPFENKDLIDKKNWYPADYICEAIDQTRGWFYTLLAVATLLEKGACYKNVICLGHINDKHGKKMSKSKGNIVDPWEVMNSFGVDALRFHLYTVNQPGEPKNFDSKSVADVLKKNLLILWNVFSFYQMYALETDKKGLKVTSENILDQWITAKLIELHNNVTASLEKYDITTSARKITEFINELSTWYVRRSRNRFKVGGNSQLEAVGTLGFILLQLAKIMAPYTPFVADKLYLKLTENCPDKKNEFKQSVHLESWPELQELTEKQKLILQKMDKVRNIVEKVLALRAEAKIKVRQPLSELMVTNKEIDEELIEIIKDEVNVKEIILGQAEIKLNINITEELELEGMYREIVRTINLLRKQSKLTINDFVDLALEIKSKKAKIVIDNMANDIKEATLIKNINEIKTETKFSKEIKFTDGSLWIGIIN